MSIYVTYNDTYEASLAIIVKNFNNNKLSQQIIFK